MKKLLKILVLGILSLIGIAVLIVLLTILWISVTGNNTAEKNAVLAGAAVKTISVDGFTFRDLNKNEKLDPYEDNRQPREVRVNDLLSQMSLDEKAGTLFIQMIAMKKDGNISEKPSLKDVFRSRCPAPHICFTERSLIISIFLLPPERFRLQNGITDFRKWLNEQGLVFL